MSFYFHWCADGNTTFGVDDYVVDESIFAFRVTHGEGDPARLELDVRNPRVGLLTPGRDRWAWLSWKKPDNSVVPLFHGRLVGIPNDMDEEIVQFVFVARPPDMEEQKKALAATLRVAPYWDPIWFADEELENADAVLEGRTALYHFGRTDKTVTISDFLIGEDGTVTFFENDVFDVTMSIVHVPLKSVKVEASVNWKQFGSGIVDLQNKLLAAFGGTVQSYSGQGLEKDWPLPGIDIGGGWMFYDTPLDLLSGDGVTPTYIETEIVTLPTEDDPTPDEVDPIRFYLWVFSVPSFKVAYRGERERKEKLSFTLTADVQELVTDTEDGKEETLTFNSSSIALPDATGNIPIGDVRRDSYFNQERGKRSVNWLIAAARAKLCMGARAVEVQGRIRFEDAVALSCRHSAIISADVLPGGEAGGKVTSYAFSMSEGVITGEVTIGCSVGRGGDAETVDPGDPVYVEVGYVEPGYQQYEGGEIQPIPDSVTYPSYYEKPIDDGLPLWDLNEDNIINGKRASALFTFTGVPIADETVTIGVRVYTWKVDGTGAANTVRIGSNEVECVRNLISAVNAVQNVDGILYGAGTEAHVDVAASTALDVDEDGEVMRARARIGGTAGNALATTDTSTNASWSSVTLVGGTPLGSALEVINPVEEQAVILGEVYNTIQEAADALGHDESGYTRVQIDLRPIEGGPFETVFTVVPTVLKIVKTIDLET